MIARRKRSFSDLPKENSLIFALRRWILRKQNPRAISDRPYGYSFNKLMPPDWVGGLVLSFENHVAFRKAIVSAVTARARRMGMATRAGV